MRTATNRWITEAIKKLEADAGRGADPLAEGRPASRTTGGAAGRAARPETPLRRFPLPPEWGIDLYLKDESAHPTGSLKHRLAQSLLMFALVNGDLNENTTLVEASSGSTAVSEAYFARLLGLDFVAVVPATTSPSKLALIEQYGGTCRLVADPNQVYAEAERLGAQDGWFYLDQFTNASVVTDWRCNNIASAIFDQLALEPHPEPRWIVVGAGTGGTSATIGRYSHYTKTATRVAVVDPEGSAFAQAWAENCRHIIGCASRIEGIGRPRVEPSFIPAVIDDVLRVPDAGSIAAMRLLGEVTGIHAGGSTGTNLYGAFQLIARMRAAGETGSVVTLICDGGERYLDSYYSDAWVAEQGFDLAAHAAQLRAFLQSGIFAVAA